MAWDPFQFASSCHWLLLLLLRTVARFRRPAVKVQGCHHHQTQADQDTYQHSPHLALRWGYLRWQKRLETCFSTTILPTPSSSSPSPLADSFSLPLLRSSPPPLLPQPPQSWDWAGPRSETDLAVSINLTLCKSALLRAGSAEVTDQGRLKQTAMSAHREGASHGSC